MAEEYDSTVVVEHDDASRLPNAVRGTADLAPSRYPGCTVYSHFNGPTDQLSGVSTGMVILDPGAQPHDPHRHPEEEFMIVATGTGEIVCGEQTTRVGPGSVMYCAGNVRHGIRNTGAEPMTFYWSKWTARGS